MHIMVFLVHVLTNIVFCCPEKSKTEGCYLNFVHSNKWMKKRIYTIACIDIQTLLYIWISEGVSFFRGGVLQNMTSIPLNTYS